MAAANGGNTIKILRITNLKWSVHCALTQPGDVVMVVGSDFVIGNWNPLQGLPMETNAERFPMWITPEYVTLSHGIVNVAASEESSKESQVPVLQYKYLIYNRQRNALTWEPFSGNRTIQLPPPDAYSIVQDVWGNVDVSRTAVVRCRRTCAGEAQTASSAAGAAHKAGAATDSSGPSEFVEGIGSNTSMASDSTRSVPYDHLVPLKGHRDGQKKTPDQPRLRRQFRREVFILSNSGCMADRYKEQHVVGRGTWGEVKVLFQTDTGAKRACKKIPKFFVEDIDRFRQEIDLMKSLDHPNIVRLYETFEDASDIYLVMEYCAGGELFDRLIEQGTFTEQMASVVMKQILSAVAYCHSKRVAHRDLKPENFLFLTPSQDSPLKLIDFGLASRFIPGEPMGTRAGTPYYVSPQVLEGRYGPECDVWSVGVIMYILLCGYPPFNAMSDRAIMTKVRVGEFGFPDAEWRDVSDEAKDLLRWLLKRHAKQRVSAEHALRHPWFEKQRIHLPPKPLSMDILSKFRRFHGLSRLKKIALTVIAQHIDEADIKGLKDIFMQLDTSGDGVLSAEEIREGVERAGFKLPHDVDAIIESIDTSGTGTIDYTEFIAACLHQSHYIEEEACRAAFRIFDTDATGSISGAELKRVFLMAGDRESDATAELLEADLDGDGKISFAEFVNLMRRVPSRTLLGYNPEETVTMMKKMSSRTNVQQ